MQRIFRRFVRLNNGVSSRNTTEARHFSTMSEADATKDDVAADSSKPVEKQLPKLSAAEFRQYNRLAEHMDYFHDNFRQSWKVLYGACENNKRPAGMSIRQYIQTGLQFCHHLTMHHNIEEQHVFPLLAKKMPAFQRELELVGHHKQIHKGLEKLEEYLESCRDGETELRLDRMKTILDSFGEVLLTHLDEEVKELGAENMRKYWSLDEVRRLPM